MIEHFEREVVPIASFEQYRTLCDSVDEFRKVGIQSELTYKNVIEDPNSLYVEFDGMQVPLLAPIDDEKMYQENRCKMLTEREDVRLLAVPLALLDAQPGNPIRLPEHVAVIIEEFEPTQDSHELPGLFDAEGIEVIDFRNPDLAGFAGHETAWMASYKVTPVSESETPRRFEGGRVTPELMNLWKAMREEKGEPTEIMEHATGVYFFSDQELVANPWVIDGLWGVSEKGFGENLGKGHPLSMEFSREFFDTQITAPDTMTAVYFENGEPLCFSFIAPNFSTSDWLNLESTAMQEYSRKAEESQRVPIHWYELISKGERGMGFGVAVLNEFMELAARSGYTYEVFFESTNLSSLYIPDMVASQVGATPGLHVEGEVEKIGQLNYWAIRT